MSLGGPALICGTISAAGETVSVGGFQFFTKTYLVSTDNEQTQNLLSILENPSWTLPK